MKNSVKGVALGARCYDSEMSQTYFHLPRSPKLMAETDPCEMPYLGYSEERKG